MMRLRSAVVHSAQAVLTVPAYLAFFAAPETVTKMAGRLLPSDTRIFTWTPLAREIIDDAKMSLMLESGSWWRAWERVALPARLTDALLKVWRHRWTADDPLVDA